nr:MAG: carboxylesterase [Pseudomonadota bacterium]
MLFYIHGGAYKVGSAIDNDPSRIAKLTDTVVVMINYRLGPFGFLAHPTLSAEARDGTSGEYGLLDQQAALEWVHDNIDAFGGDPRNITIAGASAGGWSVCAHLTSPRVAGLFSRAVIQSGDCVALTRAEAEGEGLEFAEAAGCEDAPSSECLRRKTAEELLAADSWDVRYRPIVGGRVLPEDPDAAIAAGRFSRVPVLLGSARDEYRGDLAAWYPMTEDTFVFLVNDAFEDDAPAVLAEYPLVEFEDPAYAFAEILVNSGFPGIGGCATRHLALNLARHVPVYRYEFYDQGAPVPGWLTIPPDYELGASHGTDEMYWFDRPFHTVVPLDAMQEKLANQMVEYLGAFAEHGAPKAKHQPSWPRFESKREVVMRLAPHAVEPRTDFDDEHRCDFWSSLGY